MALDDILKNMNLFVDGRGYAGNVEELTPPKLTMKTEEFRNGGMDAPVEIEMGMEKLESSFTLTRYSSEVLKLFGLAPGNQVPLTLRGAVESEDGATRTVVINLRGRLKEMDPGSWKPASKVQLKGTVAIRYYKLSIDDEVIHEIDVVNMIRVINGTDQLAAQRAALGM